MTRVDRENRACTSTGRSSRNQLFIPSRNRAISGVSAVLSGGRWRTKRLAVTTMLILMMSIKRAVIGCRHWSGQQPITVPYEELTSHGLPLKITTKCLCLRRSGRVSDGTQSVNCFETSLFCDAHHTEDHLSLCDHTVRQLRSITTTLESH